MPYRNISDGLYLVKQKSSEKGVDHYGVLDIGNRLNHPQANGINPVIVHQSPPSIKIEWFEEIGGDWGILGVIIDEGMAKERMNKLMENPQYDLFGHNCEHFARFVATGKRESTQLQTVGTVLGLAALVFVALR